MNLRRCATHLAADFEAVTDEQFDTAAMEYNLFSRR